MFIKKRYFFIILVFFSSITIFLNFGFSPAKSNLNAEIEECIEFEESSGSVENITIDYKSLLDHKLSYFTSSLEKKAKRTRFNGVVLVAYKNQIIFENAYGYKNPIQKEKLKKDVSFELASISKQFTAAAILKLEELGKVDLEQPLSSYFPEFKFKNIKVIDFLKHTTGLWDYMYLTEAYWEEPCAPDHNDIISLINTHQPRLNFNPGRWFSYSNTNYALLVALIEKLSNQPFEEFLEKHFFNPYCIDEAYVGVDSRKLKNVANGYQRYGRGYIALPPSFHNGALGDKGIHTNAENLWLWFRALKNNESLSKSSVEKMFNLDNYQRYKYGMGFRTRLNHNKELEIYHDGLWDGFRNGLHYYPEKDLTIILLSHTQNKNKSYFQNHIKNQAISMIDNLTD